MNSQFHIKAIVMQNIQSWKGEEDAQKIVLTEDKLNVIIGRNETGKSVLAKVFRQMCFPNFYGSKGRRSLLRRGSSRGTVTFQLYNGTIINFVITPTFQVYQMKTASQQKPITWKQNSLPEEIRKELGWYIDTDNNILLNLIDGEQYMPFIDSPQRFNAGVLKFVTEDPDLETVISNTREYIDTLKDLADDEAKNVDIIYHKNTMVNYTDTKALEDKIKNIDNIINAYNPLYTIKYQLMTLNNLKAPTKPKVINDNIDKTISTYKELSQIALALSKLSTHNKSHITRNFEHQEDLASTIDTIKKLNWIKKQIKDVHNINSKLTKAHEDLASTQNHINRMQEENPLCPLCGHEWRGRSPRHRNSQEEETQCQHKAPTT